jgi:hypothetical protein
MIQTDLSVISKQYTCEEVQYTEVNSPRRLDNIEYRIIIMTVLRME